MANAKHTPGPWDVSFGRNDAAIHAGGTIAMIDDVMTGWRANAALIAAAPELLAALEAMTAAFDWQAPNANPAINAAVEAARTAISKALGQTD